MSAQYFAIINLSRKLNLGAKASFSLLLILLALRNQLCTSGGGSLLSPDPSGTEQKTRVQVNLEPGGGPRHGDTDQEDVRIQPRAEN